MTSSSLDMLSLRIIGTETALGLEPGEQGWGWRELGQYNVNWELEQGAGRRPAGTVPRERRRGPRADPGEHRSLGWAEQRRGRGAGTPGDSGRKERHGFTRELASQATCHQDSGKDPLNRRLSQGG